MQHGVAKALHGPWCGPMSTRSLRMNGVARQSGCCCWRTLRCSDSTSSVASSSLALQPWSTALSNGSTWGWTLWNGASLTLCRWTPSRPWRLLATRPRCSSRTAAATRGGCRPWPWRTTWQRRPSWSRGRGALPGTSAGSRPPARWRSAAMRRWGPPTRSGTRAVRRQGRSRSTRGRPACCAAPGRASGSAWTSRRRPRRGPRLRPVPSWRRPWASGSRTCSSWVSAPQPRRTGCWRCRQRPSPSSGPTPAPWRACSPWTVVSL
mmetsp:Transcript_92097/g.260683  ORF Transcript_92097/g.260683 Transcript_92097/m.260683 type:complete len:264 (-) Transcript_92097:532-1323(-)